MNEIRKEKESLLDLCLDSNSSLRGASSVHSKLTQNLAESESTIRTIAILPVVDELAGPVVRVIAISRTGVGGAVREPAVPPGELNTIGGLVRPELGAFNRVRGDAVLDPVDKGVDDVCLGGRGGLALAKHPCARARNAAYAAVRHAADAEVAEEGVEVACGGGELRGNVEVVALRVRARGKRICEAVVHEQLAAGVAEGAEIGVERGRVAHLLVEAQSEVVVIGADGVDVERGVVVNGAEEVAGDALHASGELAESEGVNLGAWEEAGVAQRVVDGQGREDAIYSLDLLGGEAVAVAVDTAVESTRVERANGRVLDDSISHAIEGFIAVCLNLGLHKDPLILCEVRVISFLASELDEPSTPRLQILEVCRRCSRNDTVKVLRMVLSRMQALLAASRAADVVRIRGVLAVECIRNFLADFDGSVTGAIGPVDDLFVGVHHPGAIEGGSVVSGVVANSGKAKARDVLHVDVVDAAVDAAIVGAHGAAIVVVFGRRKPDFDIGLALAARLHVHLHLANANLGGEGITTLRVGLAIWGVDGDIGLVRGAGQAVEDPVAGREAVAQRGAVTHVCCLRFRWRGRRVQRLGMLLVEW